MYQTILQTLSHISLENLSKVIFSGGKNKIQRIAIRPILQKGESFLQAEKQIGTQALHENFKFHKIFDFLHPLLADNHFTDVNILTLTETIAFKVSKKGKVHQTVTKHTQAKVQKNSHNNHKNYILTEGMHIPALVDLGIFNSDFKIIKGKHDKFVQINKYLEMIDAELKNYDKTHISVIDFGCGKSYLTFILYDYLTRTKGLQASIIGYDLKEEVITSCRTIAQKYGYSGIDFRLGDIATQGTDTTKANMMVTLHACDIATDYALAHAIKLGIPYLFCVPCCQKEINSQLKIKGDLQILTQHGLYKERFSSLFTDAIRCEVLAEYGYRVDVVEFVDFSNTPKNAMIRAKLNVLSQPKPNLDKMLTLCNAYSVSHTLIKLLQQ